MSLSLQTSMIGDGAALDALEAEWWDLWDACPAATPFRSPAWLLPWWDSFAPGPLRTVAVRREGRLVALAPLYLEPASRRLLPLGIGISDDLDMLAVPGCGQEAGAAILDTLAGASDWDRVSLEELAPDATALLWRAPEGWADTLTPQSQCPVLTWPAGTSGIENLIPPRKLRKLRMARNRTARRGGAVESADAATAPAFLEALFRLHAARWESRGEVGVLADPLVQAHHRAALPKLVAHGLLYATLMRIESRVAGVCYGMRRGATLYAYLGGFDPNFAFESPGTVLMGDAVERMIREGAGRLDLLRGQEPYKYEWGALDRPHQCRTLRRAGDS